MSDSESEPKPNTKSYIPCPICMETKRYDTMRSHIVNKHCKKNLSDIIDKPTLEIIIRDKIPMVWRITTRKNTVYRNIPNKDKSRDFCVCLVCKEVRYVGGYNNDLPPFLKEHSKSKCRAQWNKYANLFGIVETPIDNTNDTEVMPTVQLINEEIVSLKLENAELSNEIRKKDVEFNNLEHSRNEWQLKYNNILTMYYNQQDKISELENKKCGLCGV